MRSIALKGHERALTYLKYNKEGDIFFSCARDKDPTLWLSSSGERIGTYSGHSGAIWHIDITSDSKYCVTASGDQSFIIWEVQTGKLIVQKNLGQTVRVAAFSEDNKRLFVCLDSFAKDISKICIFDLPEDLTQLGDPTLIITDLHLESSQHINDAVWTPANQGILCACQDGYVRCFDPITGKIIHEIKAHEDSVSSISLSKDGLFFVTASKDSTAKLYETFSFEQVAEYKTDRPLNSAAISPILDHVAVVGGTEARDVTTTKGSNMETIFFNLPTQEEIGRVSGGFGTMNCIAFNPDGRSFIIGGEDGYVRVYFFDNDYFEYTDKQEKELRDLDELARQQEQKINRQ